MCTCYNNLKIKVLDRGEEKTVFATLEDVEELIEVVVERDGEMIDGLQDKGVLSDEAMDQVVAHVQALAAKQMLPCHCSGRSDDSPYCACRQLSKNFRHPRGRDLTSNDYFIEQAASSLIAEVTQLLTGPHTVHNMSLLSECISTMKKE